jgi:hypothetical protein
MMCEEEAIYAAYLEWKAQKDREEAAAAAAEAQKSASTQSASPEPAPSKPAFTCD